MYLIYETLYTQYTVYYYDYFGSYPPSNYFMYPFWNASTRHTRNMSYDLRGDVPIPPSYVGPWNISENAPIQNKTLDEIS